MLKVHVHQLPWLSAGYSGVESLEHRHKVNQIESDGSAAPGRERLYVGFGDVLHEYCWRSVQERVRDSRHDSYEITNGSHHEQPTPHCGFSAN